MLVVPADAHIDPAREDTYARRPRDVAAAGPRDRRLRYRGPARDPRDTGRSARRPSTATSSRTSRAGADIDGLRGLSACPSLRGEAQARARAEDLPEGPGVAWNAGIFLWRRRAIRAALERYTGLIQSLEPMFGSPDHARPRLRGDPARRLDRLRRHGERGPQRRRSRWRRWMSAGRISGRGRHCSSALGARGEGAVVQAGETVEVGDDDLVVRRVDGRLGVIAPPERGSMTATQPIAVLRGSAPTSSASAS